MNPNSLTFSIVLAGATLASSALIAVLKTNGVIDTDTAARALGVVLGLMVVVYANAFPKQIARGDAGVRRFVGWTLVVGYLAYAGIWAFAPMEYTLAGSLIAGIGAVVVAFAYCALKRPSATT